MKKGGMVAAATPQRVGSGPTSPFATANLRCGQGDPPYSCVSAFLIRFFEPDVLRDESGDGIGQVRFSGSAETRCASS